MRFLSTYITAVLMLFTCSPPPPLPLEDVPAAVALITPEDTVSAIAAFGDVRVTIDGEEHRGKLEVHRRGTGEFSADFYALLGITVGSIRADNDRGTVAFDGGTYAFTKTQAMDTLPFTWGQDLTLGDLMRIMTGEVPLACAERLRQAPDSCIDGGKTISALWKTDTLDIRAILRKKSREAECFVFVFKKRKPYRSLTLQAFSGRRAHKIELRENDTNYFSIRYAKLKCD